MNKIRTVLLALTTTFATTTFAQNAQEIIRAVDSNEDTHSYYYNEQNQLFWESYGTTRREYKYNAAGQCTEMNQYAWVAAEGNYSPTQKESYTYDAAGNLSQKVVDKSINNPFGAVWTYKYFDYQNGVATYYDEYKGSSLYYMYKQLSEFDAQGHQTKCTVMYADPDKYQNPTHETVDYKDKENEYTKTYNAEGRLTAEFNGKMSYEYQYTELSAAYAPKNLKAETGNGKIKLTWDPVAGAEKYIVSYDLKRIEVEGCEYSTAIATGERQFTVQAVVGGMERNAATPLSVTISDTGMLPISNLATGMVTETLEDTESEAMGGKRLFYNIALSWSLPEGHSEVVKYILYYDSRTFGKDVMTGIVDPAATSYTLKIDPYEVADYDEEGNPCKGYDTNISISVVYTSGESERSNVVTLNPYNLIHGITGIRCTAPSAKTESTTSFTTSGLPASAHHRGIVIQGGKKYVK